MINNENDQGLGGPSSQSGCCPYVYLRPKEEKCMWNELNTIHDQALHITCYEQGWAIADQAVPFIAF